MKIVVVGAGLGGLVCARELRKAGIDALLLEASDDVGGRVRTDIVDGFKIDRGFQVLFDAYPAVRRNLDLPRLALQAFDPGAVICIDGAQSVLTDPLRDGAWQDVAAAAVAPVIPIADKVRTLALSRRLSRMKITDEEEPDEVSTEEYLRREGYSTRTIDTFFRPFYGGIFLDRSLGTSAAAFRFYLRMLTEGSAMLPEGGIGSVTQQLAEPLTGANSVRLNAPVHSLMRTEAAVTGVVLEGGEEITADGVVLAVEAPAAARLTNISVPDGALGVTAVYFAGDRAVTQSRKLFLNASADAYVNNAQALSTVAPSYAPAGRHLLGATILGAAGDSDENIISRAWADIQSMFSGDREAVRALASYSPLCVRRIPYSQFPQPPGVQYRLQEPGLHGAGLFIAGDWTQSSSINGAMTSGEQAAAAVVRSAVG